jgi:hypothetical protein
MFGSSLRGASSVLAGAIVFGSIAVPSVVLAKKDNIEIMEMECPSEGGVCSPINCRSFCSNKGAGIQCQLGLFKEGWIVKLACCDCSPDPISPTGRVANTCTSNADCGPSQICFIGHGSSDKPPLPAAKFERSTPPEPAKGACVPRFKTCRTETDCVRGQEVCFESRCVAY